MAVALNASTPAGYIQTADTSGDLALQSNGTTQFNVTSTGAYGQIKSGTAVTASGSSVDFTSIPSWVKRITVMFNGVSTNGTSPPQIQIGSGSFTTSGYLGSNSIVVNAAASASALFTTGYGIGVNTLNWASSVIVYGSIQISLISGNTWVASGSVGRSDAPSTYLTSGSIALSGTLDRVRITTVNGTDAFDAGTINLLWE